MLDLLKINSWFYRYGNWIVKRRWVYLFCLLALLVVTAFGLPHLKKSSDEDNWFGDEDKTIVDQNQMEAIFGNTEMAAVHISCDDVFTQENLQLIRQMGYELEDKVPYADDVLSITALEFSQGTDWGMVIEDLIPEEIPTDKQALEELRTKALSKELIKGQLISPDSKEAWIILRLLRYDKEDDDASLHIGKAVLDISRNPAYAQLNPKATGIPVVMYGKTDFFASEVPRVMKFSFLVVFIILLFAFRSLRGMLVPFLTIVFGLMLVFGLQGHLGLTFDPTVVTMPIFLGLAVAVGYNIHFFNFFKTEFAETGKRKESVYYALKETGWPILFTALTTVLALCSFIFISSPILQWIGLTSAAIVLVSFLLVLSLTPILFSFGKDKQANLAETVAHLRWATGWLRQLSDWIFGNSKKIIFFYILITLLGCFGFSLFRISFDAEDTVGAEVPYVKRIMKVARSQIGSLNSYNIIIEFPENGSVKEPENMRKLDKLVSFIQSETLLTKRVTSIVKILKDLNKVLFDDKESEFRIPDTKSAIAQELLLYENSGGKEATRWIDYDYRRYRIQVELSEMDTGLADKDIAKIKKKAAELFPTAKIQEVGTMAKMIAMAERVTWGQIYSFLLALVIIAIILMLAFGGIRIGLIGMIPNITPALLAGGAMGYLDIPLDMITVTIMPMVLGLAVDDTIHFINHYKLYYQKTGSYKRASSDCFASIGVALVMTSLVLILNYSVYLVSQAEVLRSMGILAMIGISSALLSDFFITPVLIRMLQPFGPQKVVERGKV